MAMKKLLLILVLAFVSSNAIAEWVRLGGGDGTTFYYMPESIRISGDKTKVWVLYDYKSVKTIDTDRYLSIKAQLQLDCQEEGLKVLYSSFYSENMGVGKVVESANLSSYNNLRPIMPRTEGQYLWLAVCSR
jgi:hypothetical protein